MSKILTVCLPPSFAIQWMVLELAAFGQQIQTIDGAIKALILDKVFKWIVDVAIY